MQKFVLAIFLITCICAYPQKHNFNVKFNEIEVKQTNRKAFKYTLKPTDLDDCTLTALFSQDAMNLCADEIFQEVDTYTAENYNSVDLPDVHGGFNYTLIITYDGSIDLTNGVLTDISTVHRDGDVIINIDLSENVNLTLPIVFDELDFSYDYSAKILGLGPTGGIEGSVKNLEVSFSLSYDHASNQITLDSYEVVQSGDIDFEFTGNALVDWLLDLLSEVVTSLLKNTLDGVINDIVGDALNAAVDALNQALASGEAPASKLSNHVYKTILNHKILRL